MAGRSAFSQRAEVAVSGRMTPTLPPPAAEPEEAVELPLEAGGVLEEEEQPATPNARAAAPTVAVRTKTYNRIALRPSCRSEGRGANADGAAARQRPFTIERLHT